MKRLFFLFILFLFIGEPLTVAQAIERFAVDPEYLISDTEMLDVSSMSVDNIEDFLMRGSLASYRATDKNGIEQRAAKIIWDVAQEFELSPRFLLVLLQREQSLVEDPEPTQNQLDWAMGYAVCDSCSKSDPIIQKYKGFGNQLYYAGQRIRESYLSDLESRGYTQTGIGPGIESIIDGATIIPVNNATASLYTYTPHLHGNENFARIWNRWFNYDYLSGSLLQDKETGGIWLIQHNTRRPITSRTAFYSRFNPETVISVSPSALERYPIGLAISFPNYSLLRSPGGTVYLIVDDTRRGFASQEAFRSLGFSSEEITDVTWEDLIPYTEGESLTLSSANPEGVLFQDKTTGGVFFVEDEKKHPILSRELLKNRFPNQQITVVIPEDLDTFERAEPVLFQDGTLIGVQGSHEIFVISEGMRHPIADELTFNSFGWEWNQVVWTTQRAVLEHPLGDLLRLETEPQEELEEIMITVYNL
ncbi:TPA: hypothetical protein DCW61_04145 [Candidatus Uhrbacteria bacterium]|nr:hypothetical protein [Candidatus Uhrbacteria bacterium]